MSEEQSEINWRTIGVRRDRKYEGLIERLSTTDSSGIFRFHKDLMVFAAMVGFSQEKSVPVSNDNVGIILDTYSSDNKDAFIYLLALMETKDAQCLKDEKLHDSVKVFEGYCNAGLGIIEDWLEDNPADPSGINTILEKIYERTCLNEAGSDNNDGLLPKF
jgi:dnd system-associated protein 4